MTDETFNEISEYLDMLEQDEEEEEVLEGMERLTFKGFLQVSLYTFLIFIYSNKKKILILI